MVAIDAVHQIVSFNAGRDPERLALKYSKMRASTFAFLRGSCHLFYDRLPLPALPKNAPWVWACGDLHLENFGSYKADNRQVYFDVNDFDEAALAPASWDLIRMLTSIWMGTDGMVATVSDTRALCACFLDAYASALAGGKSYWVERETAQGPVRSLLDSLRARTRIEFLDARTEVSGKKRTLRTDGKKTLPASTAQRIQVTAFMASFAQHQTDPAFYQVLDIARRVAGTGSLGLDRFAILVKGKGSPDGNYLLDLKRATPSALVPHLAAKQPKWPSQAHRVVALQQRCQAMPMAFLQPVFMGDDAYVLRGLQPSEDRVAVSSAKLSLVGLKDLLGSLGKVVAWMHLRAAGRQGSAIADELMAWGQKSTWQQKMLRATSVCADLVCADAQSFNAAYDSGLLREHSASTARMPLTRSRN